MLLNFPPLALQRADFLEKINYFSIYLLLTTFILFAIGLFLCSRRQILASTIGLFLAFFYVFSTPFILLRRALTLVVSADDDGANHRVGISFVLFRATRLAYAAMFVISLGVLSYAIALAGITFYPGRELSIHRTNVAQLAAQVAELDQATASATRANDTLQSAQAAANVSSASARQAHRRLDELGNPENFHGRFFDTIRQTSDTALLAEQRAQLDKFVLQCRSGIFSTLRNCDTLAQYGAELLSRADAVLKADLALSKAQKEVERAERPAQEQNAVRAQKEPLVLAARDVLANDDISRGEWLWPHSILSLSIAGWGVAMAMVVAWSFGIVLELAGWLLRALAVAAPSAASSTNMATDTESPDEQSAANAVTSDAAPTIRRARRPMNPDDTTATAIDA